MFRLRHPYSKFVLLLLLIVISIGVIPAIARPTYTEQAVEACAITPNLLGGQGFSLAGQGFSLAGQGFSLAGQGFSLAGQGFSLAGQGLDPLAVAAEIRDNPVTPGKWINERLDFFLNGLGFNENSTAILIVDEFNAPEAHGFEVERVLEDTLKALRQSVPDIKIASVRVDISEENYSADGIATAISDKVNELRGTYHNFVFNMSFGLIPCTADGPVIDGIQLPAFDFAEAQAVISANNQSTPSLAVTPILECITEDSSYYEGGEGEHRSRDTRNATTTYPRYTAYFGYKNENDQLVNIAVGNNNRFSPQPKDRSQPTQFEPGRQSFVFAVPFESGNLVWTVKGPDGQTSTAIASRYSPRCEDEVPAPTQKVTPIVECVADLGDGYYRARFGYNNPNAVGVKIPVGSQNKFTPTPANRGQVVTFVPGLHKDVFEVDFNGNNLRWTLNGINVIANKTLPACPEQLSFGLADYFTLNQEIPQSLVGEYWNQLASSVNNDEFQPLRLLLQTYLSDSSNPDNNFTGTAIASSGNYRPWLGEAPLAPASWPETIAVGATLGDTTTMWQFSQDGNVLAPGASYLVGPNSYIAGTSFAAPVFSTLVGLCATIPDGLVFDGTNPPLVPPVLDGAGNKILANALIGTDDLSPLACNITAGTLNVEIDIKPGSEENQINLKSWGKLAVAIISTESFDAGDVDPRSVTVAGAPVIIKSNGKAFAQFEDVNHDGLRDLVVRVQIQDLQLDETSTTGILIGLLKSGRAIQGADRVNIIPAHGPDLESPVIGQKFTKSTVKLSWTLENIEEGAATCYLVQVDNQEDFSSPEQSSVVVRARSYTTAPLANGLYYWRVGVSDCSSTVITPWSETWSFNVKVR